MKTSIGKTAKLMIGAALAAVGASIKPVERRIQDHRTQSQRVSAMNATLRSYHGNLIGGMPYPTQIESGSIARPTRSERRTRLDSSHRKAFSAPDWQMYREVIPKESSRTDFRRALSKIRKVIFNCRATQPVSHMKGGEALRKALAIFSATQPANRHY